MATVRINTGGSSEEKEVLTPITNKDQVIVSKRSLGSKFADAFISDAAKDVKDYIIMDVIVPGIKDTILNCMEMIFFGGTSSRRSSARVSRIYDNNSNYRAFYQSEYDSYGAPPKWRNRNGQRYSRDTRDDRFSDRIDYRNIIVRDRGSAEQIVSTLRGRIEKYGEATKADLFELIDTPSTYQDNNWGWRDPRDIGVRRVTSGYLIDVADADFLGE